MEDWYQIYQINAGTAFLVAIFRYQPDAFDYLNGMQSGYMSHRGRVLERKNVDV